MLNLSGKEISSPPEKGKVTIHIQSPTRAKTIVICTILTGNQSCIYVAVCAWYDQNNQNKEARHREVPELSEADLTNLTYRKVLTASGDRMRDSSEAKTMLKCHKMQVFQHNLAKANTLTRPSFFKKEGKLTLVFREYTLLAAIQIQKVAFFFCAINVRVGK